MSFGSHEALTSQIPLQPYIRLRVNYLYKAVMLRYPSAGS